MCILSFLSREVFRTPIDRARKAAAVRLSWLYTRLVIGLHRGVLRRRLGVDTLLFDTHLYLPVLPRWA